MTEINWSRYIPEEAIVFELEKPKKLRFDGFKEATVAAHKEGVIDPIMMPTLVLTVTHEDEKPVFKKWYCAAKKAIMTLKPYIVDGTYKKRVFTITKHGKAPAAWYEFEVGTFG